MRRNNKFISRDQPSRSLQLNLVSHLYSDISCGVTGGLCVKHGKRCHPPPEGEDWQNRGGGIEVKNQRAQENQEKSNIISYNVQIYDIHDLHDIIFFDSMIYVNIHYHKLYMVFFSLRPEQFMSLVLFMLRFKSYPLGLDVYFWLSFKAPGFLRSIKGWFKRWFKLLDCLHLRCFKAMAMGQRSKCAVSCHKTQPLTREVVKKNMSTVYWIGSFTWPFSFLQKMILWGSLRVWTSLLSLQHPQWQQAQEFQSLPYCRWWALLARLSAHSNLGSKGLAGRQSVGCSYG